MALAAQERPRATAARSQGKAAPALRSPSPPPTPPSEPCAAHSHLATPLPEPYPPHKQPPTPLPEPYVPHNNLLRPTPSLVPTVPQPPPQHPP
ncbi:uncharacterized protein [Melanerpes formicivorus]|uniref:uncharacterized protein n=1 Tax=Melanerpes formicivorus TaxID=211600 RepID=UPI00358E9B0C